jgi:hypothetical protein
VGAAGGTSGGLVRQESSLDEILSSSPDGSKTAAIPAPIITPKVSFFSSPVPSLLSHPNLKKKM